jgi:uncharacterized protein (DUF362 family)
MPRVSIVKTADNLYASFARAVEELDLQPVSSGDYVLIKPNLVQPVTPDSGQITSPKLLEAIARYCLDAGARRVIIGEGPSYYQPESCLRECFTHTGVSQMVKRLGIEWILFDEHGYRTFKGIPGSIPGNFRVSEFAFECDKFINVPVLKTHFLTKVTLSMKNLKGCLKREDKPLFHRGDLASAIVELNKIVAPSLNVIDCTAKSIGHIGGAGSDVQPSREGGGFIITSSDIVAIDAVGSAVMGIDPSTVRTISLGKAAGIGEGDLALMDITGEELKRLRFKVELPQEQIRQSFPLLKIAGAEKACSGCLIPLFSALFQLQKRGMQLKKPLVICLGSRPPVPGDMDYLLVGDCACGERKTGQAWVEGCPPDKKAIVEGLNKYMND